jgi:hypothetical protein
MTSSNKLIQSAAGVGGANPNAFDIAYLEKDTSKNFDLDYVAGNFTDTHIITNDTNGLVISDDGYHIYVTDAGSILEYVLSSPFALITAPASPTNTYTDANFGGTNLHSIAFSTDGTKMYAGINDTTEKIRQFSLSTAWDASSLSYDSVELSLSMTYYPSGLWFSADGQRMYISGRTDGVFQYSLSTPWDLSTATDTGNTFTFGAEAGTGQELCVMLNSTGTRMFLFSADGDNYLQYSLSTAWDVSSASYDSKSYNTTESSSAVGTVDRGGNHIFFARDASSEFIEQVALGVFDTSGIARAVRFGDSGNKLYITRGSSIDEYDLSTPYDVFTATLNQTNSSLNSTNEQPFFWKHDGTKLFTGNSTDELVREYSVSTAWDISSISFVGSKSIASQDTQITGLCFNDDGSKMYIIGVISDSVHEYELSTNWLLSSASYARSFSVATEDTSPQCLGFNSDGTKMYVGGFSENIIEYSLSTPFLVTSATLSQSVDFSQYGGRPVFDWSADGEKLILTNTNIRSIVQYNVSPT